MRYPVQDDENDKVAIIGSLAYIKKAMDMEKLEYQCSIIPEITTITPTTEIFTVKILKPEADSEGGASTTTEKEFLTDELKTGVTVNISFVKIVCVLFVWSKPAAFLGGISIEILEEFRSHLVFFVEILQELQKSSQEDINHKHAVFRFLNNC